MRLRLLERRHLASVIQDRKRAAIDGLVIALALIAVFWVIRGMDLFEKLTEFVEQYEDHQLDEIVIAVLMSVFGFFLFGMRRL